MSVGVTVGVNVNQSTWTFLTFLEDGEKSGTRERKRIHGRKQKLRGFFFFSRLFLSFVKNDTSDN